MGGIQKWIADHPTLWEFIKFNILSNVATIVNFVDRKSTRLNSSHIH